MEPEDQLRRTTRDLRTRVANCAEADGGVFGHLLRTEIKLPFMCDSFSVKHYIKIKLRSTVRYLSLLPFKIPLNSQIQTALSR